LAFQTFRTARGQPEIVSGQVALPGIEPVPNSTDALFFAIYPDSKTATHIARIAEALRGNYRLQGKPLLTGRFHVTLFSLGVYANGLPPELVAAALRVGEAIAAPTFDVAFDMATDFGTSLPRRPVVLTGSDGPGTLTAFREVLGAGLNRVGLLSRAGASYRPHVTLLYDSHAGGRPRLCKVVEPVRWTGREFVLVHSLVGKKRHVPIGRWQLLPASDESAPELDGAPCH
jgi:2'-5' RNA ligase